MRTLFSWLMLAIVVVTFSGCSTKITTTATATAPDGTKTITITEKPGSIFGASDYDKFSDMHNALQEYRVQLMAGCNSKMSANPSDIEVVTSRMSEQSCKMQVAMIKFDVNAPETWPGVAKHMLSQTPISLAIIEGAKVAKAGLKKAGDTVSGNKAGGNQINGDQVTAGRDAIKTKGDVSLAGTTETTNTSIVQDQKSTNVGAGSSTPSQQPVSVQQTKTSPVAEAPIVEETIVKEATVEPEVPIETVVTP